MKKIKNFIAILLVMLMAISSVPVSAFADYADDITGGTDKYLWTYSTDSKTLCFDIAEVYTGDDRVVDAIDSILPVYSTQEDFENKATLAVNANQIENIVIGNNIIALNNIQFSFYQNLKSVTFESNSILKSIGKELFKCTEISSVEIPDSVETIGDYAFCESKIESLDLPDSLRTIGYYSFSATKIESIVIPDTVTEISKGAFTNSEIESVVIGSGVQKIAECAFSSCKNLTSITIPNNVTEIDDRAFENCTSLTSFTISSSCVFGQDVFSGCSNLSEDDIRNALSYSYTEGSDENENTTPDENNTPDIDMSNADMYGETDKYYWSYESTTQTLYFNIKISVTGENRIVEDDYNFTLPVYTSQEQIDNFDEPEINSSEVSRIIIGNNILSMPYIQFCVYPNLTSVTFESNSIIRDIADYQFDYVNISSIILPSTVKTIGNFAFYDTPINSINLPSGLTSIGEYAFSNTQIIAVAIPNHVTSIEEYAFAGSTIEEVSLGTGVTKIYNYAFANCSELSSITISNHGTTLYPSAFQNCTALTDVNFNDTCKISKKTFAGCTSLESIDLTNVTNNLVTPETSRIIPVSVFDGCTSLSTVIMPTDSRYTAIGQSAFRNTAITSLDFTSINKIGDYAFENCPLVSADLRNITQIGRNAFAGTALTSIQLDNAIIVGISSFSNCSDLETVVFNTNNNCTIQERAFENCTKLSDLTLSPYIIEIQDYAFSNCELLESVEFPTAEGGIGIKYLDQGWMAGSSIKHVKLPATIEDYSFMDSDIETVDLSEVELDFISPNAFSNCKCLTSFVIPQGVTAIGDSAFRGCINLTSIVIPESVNLIEGGAFAECTSLTHIDIPGNIPAIDSETFYNCLNLEEVVINSDIQYVASYAFSNTKISDTSFLENAETIGTRAFENCTYITSLTNCLSLRKISPYAFYNCTSLVEMSNLPLLSEISDNAFENCSSLSNISSVTSLTSIGKYAFKNCTSLVAISNLEGVTTLSTGAFSGCSSLRVAYIPSTANNSNYNSDLYRDCTSLEVVNVDSKYFGDNCFAGCNSLTTVNIGDNITFIPNNAFYGTTISEVNFSDNCNVVTIAQNAFRECPNLREFSFPDSLSQIATYAFYNTPISGVVRFGDNLHQVNAYAFSKTNIDSIEFGNYIGLISSNAFSNCSQLTSVSFDYKELQADEEEKVLRIQQYAFYNTPQLKEFSSERSIKFEEYSLTGSSIETLILNGDNYKEFASYCFQNTTALKNVDIEGTYSISSYSFDGSGITSFVFDSKIQGNILQGAFRNCLNLKSISFTDDCTITAISSYAFYNCDIQNTIKFNDNLLNIDICAFSKNINLIGVTFGRNITTINQNAFSDCPLQVVVSLDNGSLTSLNHSALFSGQMGRYENGEVRCSAASILRDFAIHYNYDYVMLDADGNEVENALIKGTFNNGTWIIRTNDLVSYEFLIDGVGTIDIDSFVDEQGNSVTIKQLFTDCPMITSMKISEGITEIPDNFLYLDEAQLYSSSLIKNLKKVTIPSTVTRIGSYAFYAANFGSFVIPDTVTEMGEYAFARANLLSGLTIGSGLKAVPDYAFYKARLGNIVIKDGVERLGKSCFAANNNIQNIYIPTSVEFIYYNPDNSADDAFIYKSNFIIVHGRRGTEAYYYTKKHNGMKFEVVMDTSRDLVHPQVYDAKGQFNTTSGKSYWYYVESTKTIYFSGNGQISMNSELDCEYDVRTVVFEYGLTGYSTNGTTVLEMLNPSYIYFPTSLISLPSNSLRGCSNLKALVIPDSVESVPSNLLDDCTSLEYIKFSGAMTNVPARFCKNMKTLKEIDFNDGIETISGAAFENCTSLKEINIPDGVITVDNYAFNKCVNVVKVSMGKKLINVGVKAFANLAYCETIDFRSVDLFDNINISLVEMFEPFKNIGASTTGTTLRIGNDVPVANLAVFHNARITQIFIGDSVSCVKNITHLPYLMEVTVSGNNNSYYSYGGALYSNDNCLILVPAQLETTEIKEGTVKIGDYAFNNSFIEHITLPSSVTEIGDYAFYNCKELETADLPNNVTKIGNGAFEGCTSLRIFYSPSKLKTIGDRAFANCTHLGTAVLSSNKLTSIGAEAFRGCTSLIGMVVPESVTEIGDRAYMNCTEMTEIYIWSAQIGEDAFKKDNNLNIFTMAGSDAYRYAREYGVEYSAYTDEDMFYDLCADKMIIYAGYLGYCTDGHGDIEWLTVYSADCENDGYMIGVCEYCSEIIDERHIPATGHSYSITADIPATSTTKGITIYNCSICGDQYCTYTPATGNTTVHTEYNVSGSVVLSLNKEATAGKSPAKNVSIVIAGNTVATTDDNGEFSFSLETGSYQAELRYAYGFTRTIYIVVEDSDVECRNIPIIGCDFNKDGKINDDDYALFQIVISSSANDPSYLDFVDMNNDGYINGKDRIYISACYGLNSRTFNYPVLVIQK